jgi:thiamine kinase-like enzyme
MRCHHDRVAPQELVRDAVERVVLSGHEGKSGAGLERIRLADGRVLICKRIEPGSDFTIEATGGLPGREILLWRAGVLDRLPTGVEHALVDAWVEGDTTVLVMRDLGDAMLTWNHRLDADRTRWVMGRVAALHRAFLGEVVPDVVPLQQTLAVFAPATARPLADQGIELMRLTLHGWELFAELVPDDVADAVFRLLDDVTPLRRALEQGPVTLNHGDLATVNMAIEDDALVLIDWAMPTMAPGALDVARFVAGCASVVELDREEILAAYRDAAGPAYDARCERLSLLAATLWLGWNKALDAAEHPDPQLRARERADLDWWVRHARTALEEGVP